MADDWHSDDPSVRAARLIDRLRQFAGAKCPISGLPVTPQEGLMSVALGHRDQAMSIKALAESLGQAPATIWSQTLEYIQARPCYRQAWDWASMREGANLVGPGHEQSTAEEGPRQGTESKGGPVETWDAGCMGCGELVMELRMRLGAMKAGAILKVIALDAGAPQDMPAWCGMTGHKLVHMQHPEYWIKRKE